MLPSYVEGCETQDGPILALFIFGIVAHVQKFNFMIKGEYFQTWTVTTKDIFFIWEPHSTFLYP